MTSTDNRKHVPNSSKLIVEDPEAFLQLLKHRLALKEGIPESQQRLIFSVPHATEDCSGDLAVQRPAEEVLGELKSWQAIVFRNGKSIGRLLGPHLSSKALKQETWPTVSQASDKRGGGVVVEVISILYDRWQPVWLKDRTQAKQLYLPVDADFTSSDYRIQVIGRSGGKPFFLPFEYTFSGRSLSAALDIEVQRADYVRRHQLVRGAGNHSSHHLRTVAVECGRGLEGFTAVFDAEDQPSWLKGVVLRFAVVAAGVADDAAPAQRQPSTPVQPKPLPTKTHSDHSGTSHSTSQVATESWLPKMHGAASSGGSGGKKSKSKHKGRAASPLEPRRTAAPAVRDAPSSAAPAAASQAEHSSRSAAEAAAEFAQRKEVRPKEAASPKRTQAAAKAPIRGSGDPGSSKPAAEVRTSKSEATGKAAAESSTPKTAAASLGSSPRSEPGLGNARAIAAEERVRPEAASRKAEGGLVGWAALVGGGAKDSRAKQQPSQQAEAKSKVEGREQGNATSAPTSPQQNSRTGVHAGKSSPLARQASSEIGYLGVPIPSKSAQQPQMPNGIRMGYPSRSRAPPGSTARAGMTPSSSASNLMTQQPPPARGSMTPSSSASNLMTQQLSARGGMTPSASANNLMTQPPPPPKSMPAQPSHPPVEAGVMPPPPILQPSVFPAGPIPDIALLGTRPYDPLRLLGGLQSEAASGGFWQGEAIPLRESAPKPATGVPEEWATANGGRLLAPAGFPGVQNPPVSQDTGLPRVASAGPQRGRQQRGFSETGALMRPEWVGPSPRMQPHILSPDRRRHLEEAAAAASHLRAFPELGGGGRALSHDSGIDATAQALLAELRNAQPDLQLGRIMTPPPPPPPRSPPPAVAQSSIQRQGSFQVPSPSYHPSFERNGQPANDMEHLMCAVTPVLEGKAEGLRLRDVWRFYEQASVYGREVYTHSRRGPALAYYTPTLSAMRLLLPCDPPEEAKDGEVHATPLLQHFETELPFNREPLSAAVGKLQAEPNAQCPESGWQDLRLADLHPASWFAVAWYPVYRIPDAPLAAKFLTFHSLLPVPARNTYFGAEETVDDASTAASAVPSPPCLPILGLKCAEQRGEPWLDGFGRFPGGSKSDWDKRRRRLQSTADSLSAGHKLRLLSQTGSWEQPRDSHSDLAWFNRHP